jgi:hypothetical protein
MWKPLFGKDKKQAEFDCWSVCFSDADFKLAPFFDGYDRNRLDEHEHELNVDSLLKFD